MEPNPIELFLHIIGVIGMFVGYGALVLGTIALRRANRLEDVRVIASALTVGRRIGIEHVSVIDAIVVASVLLIGATGLDMARYTGDWRSGWVDVAIVTLLLLAPVGPFVINPRLHAIANSAARQAPNELSAMLRNRLSDPVLTVALRTSAAILVGLVFLMTVKPSLLWSVVAIVLATSIGAVSAAIDRS